MRLLTYKLYKAEVKRRQGRVKPRLNYHNQIERIFPVSEVRSPQNRRICMKRAINLSHPIIDPK